MRKLILLAVLTLLWVLWPGDRWRGFSQVSQSGESTIALSSLPPPAAPVLVHLFEWTWPDVAQECETVLGPLGYGAVQISPATEHVVLPDRNYPWWQRYQPVSYRLESRSGSRSQLAEMVNRCHAAGVQVYADAVINHMSALPSGVGIAGSPFSKYRYPRLYEPSDFHPCKRNIQDYNNREEVTRCELSGLPDLSTGNATVRDRIAGYLLDLLSLGIDGFRIDAAKHIAAPELGEILGIVRSAAVSDPVVYQEVIDPGYEAIRKSEFYPYGQVIEFEYGRQVSEAFLGVNGKSLAQLETLGESWGLMPSDKAIVFIDNHDKQRGHGGGGNYLTHKAGPLYTLANVFMLAFPYGTPKVMSSYAFGDGDQGPPANTQGQTQGVYTSVPNAIAPDISNAPNKSANPEAATCFGKWICEHRQAAIAQMVQFRRQVSPAAPLNHWWSDGRDRIAFGRGDQGFVAINRSSEPFTQTFQTSLPAGTYCNLLASPDVSAASVEAFRDRHASVCQPIAVEATGQTTLTLAPLSAIALVRPDVPSAADSHLDNHLGIGHSAN